jgi:hypothetical protein
LPQHPNTRKRLHPDFRAWLVQHMHSMRFQTPDEWANRFELVAGFLSHTEQRCLDVQAISEVSGYTDSLLRDTVRRVGEHLRLIARTSDHEGTWYKLLVDPFSAPTAAEKPVVPEETESQMERLYRECCDEANEGVREVIAKLNRLRGQVQPAVGALVMDAAVDLSRLSTLLTEISAAGVQGDRKDYIEGVRNRIQRILKDGS